MEFSQNERLFRNIKKPRYMFLAAALLFFLGILSWAKISKIAFNAQDLVTEGSKLREEELSFETPASLFDSFFATTARQYGEIKAGESLFSALRRFNFPSDHAEKLIKALGAKVDLRAIRPGNVLMVEFSSENIQLKNIASPEKANNSLVPSAVELFTADEAGIVYSVRAFFNEANKEVELLVNKSQVNKERGMIGGVVANSVYSAIVAKGGDAQLVNGFADIFMWQFDFFRDTRDGDSYQMIFEKNVVDGRIVNYGKVLAAEYTNAAKILRGFYFKSADNIIEGYFDDKGMSLRNAFLKAPLKLAFITSPFNRRRFHPVTKVVKPHNGIDYGANLGTPFMAVASGTIVNAGYSPFNGNWARIKHINGYETEYLHANKLAKGIRVGAKVRQGQVIGYVGKTGLATGYHLHFGMKKSGAYVDPGRQKFARESGVPPKYLKEFNRSIEAMSIALNRRAVEKTDVLAIK